MKALINQGKIPALYFWRDNQSHEVDLIIEKEDRQLPVEIKSSQTLLSRPLKAGAFYRLFVQKHLFFFEACGVLKKTLVPQPPLSFLARDLPQGLCIWELSLDFNNDSM